MIDADWLLDLILILPATKQNKQLQASTNRNRPTRPPPHPTHRRPPRNHDPNAHQSKAAHVHHSSSHMQHVSSTGAVSSTNEGSI
jgi:hypothetical protein